MNKIYYVRSDKDTHFTTELVQNAGELESLSFPSDFTASKIRDCVIESITIICKQAALEWDIYLWGTSGADDASDVDLDKFLAYENFAATAAKQIAGTGNFYSSVFDLNIKYRDDGPIANTQIYATLVNRSATAKNAGATGETVVIFGIKEE